MGLSTIGPDYYTGPLEKTRLDAIGQARRGAIGQAGGEVRADDAARLAAVGSALSGSNTALNTEANVGETEAGRAQQANQFAAQSGFSNLLARLNREQQGGQFTAELGSRERLQREAFQNASNIAAGNRLAGGITAGLGGLAQFFQPVLQGAGKAANAALGF